MKSFTRLSASVLCFLAILNADTKMKTRYTASGQTIEQTVSTKGSRSRFEHGAGMVLLQQCDQKQIVTLNFQERTYAVTLWGLGASSPVVMPAGGSGNAGTVTYTTSVHETGETKQMFGHTARRKKSVIVKEPGPIACNRNKERIETDGWYIDMDAPVSSCAMATDATPAPQSSGACKDEVRIQDNGLGKLGFPLAYAMKTFVEGSGSAQEFSMEAMEFSNAALDAALFDVPPGFTQRNNPGQSAVAFRETPKAPGTIRIGVAAITNKTAKQFAAESFQQQLIHEMTQARLDVVPLTGISTEEGLETAKKLQCDYILETGFLALNKSAVTKIGGFLNKASTLTSLRGGAPSANEIFEASAEFRLVPVSGGAPRLASTVSAKSAGDLNLKTAMTIANTAMQVMPMGMMLKGMNPQTMNFLNAMSSKNMAAMGSGGLFGSLDGSMNTLTRMMQQVNKPVGIAGATSLSNDESKAIANTLTAEVKAIATALGGQK